MSTEKDTIAIILDDVLAFHKQMEKTLSWIKAFMTWDY